MNFFRPTRWHPGMGLGPKPKPDPRPEEELIEPFIPPPPDSDFLASLEDEQISAGDHSLARALSNPPSRPSSRAPSRAASRAGDDAPSVHPADSEHHHEEEDQPRTLSRGPSQRTPSRAPSRATVRPPSRGPTPQAHPPSRGPTPRPRPISRGPSPQPPPLPHRDDELFPLRAYKYRPSRGEWKHFPLSGRGPSSQESREWLPHTELRIITWNIDFMSDHPEERLYAALRHIEETVLGCKGGEAPATAVCILLQEVRQRVVPFLLQDPWVRRWFAVTPFTASKWPDDASYGNITLVSRSLDIAECHILHYGATHMHRTAVCVKVKLVQPLTQDKYVLSIVNTHLESLPVGAQVRPRQMELCARFLHLKGVLGGVIAGDMNAISPRDKSIVKDLKLKDAWRRGDDAEAGKTWGYQGQNEGNFPCARLDKVIFLQNPAYKVTEPTVIGVGLQIQHGGEALWVSDHYGLEATLRMSTPLSSV